MYRASHGRRGKLLMPNDRYAIAPGLFTLYYHSLAFDFNSRKADNSDF